MTTASFRGRPRKEVDDIYLSAAESGRKSIKELSAIVGVSRTTFWRRRKEKREGVKK